MDLSLTKNNIGLTAEHLRQVKQLGRTFEKTGLADREILETLKKAAKSPLDSLRLKNAFEQQHLPASLLEMDHSTSDDIMDTIRRFNITVGKLNFRGQSKLHTSFVFHHPPCQIDRNYLKVSDQMIEKGLFERLPQRTLDVKAIVPTQTFLGSDNMNRVYGVGAETGAFVLKIKERAFVLDGHHRIAARIAAGHTSLQAHVFSINQGV